MRFWHPQLALGFSDLPEQTFDSFVMTMANRPAVQHLRDVAVQSSSALESPSADEGIYLWGDKGSGVSHLLNATAYESYQNNIDAVYADLSQLVSFSPKCIDGLESAQLVSLDHLEALDDQPLEWSVRIYQLINDMRKRGHRLIMGAHQPPNGLQLPLVDLKTRLQWYPTYYLSPMDDQAQFVYLQRRSAEKGLEMKDDVARYLLTRVSRDVNQLNDVLEELDLASMQAKRKLTIPFIRNVMDFSTQQQDVPQEEAVA